MTMIDIKTLPLPELLLSRAAKHPDRDCIVLEGERVTYGELEVRSRQVALSLVAQGVEPGDRVGILMANCVDFVASMFGISLIGAIAVLYNSRFKAREIAHVTADSGVKAIITNDVTEQHTNYIELLRRAIPELEKNRGEEFESDQDVFAPFASAPALRVVISLGSTIEQGFLGREAFYKLGEACAPGAIEQRRLKIDVNDQALIIYTSGTTAMPKGCPLTHIVLQHAGVVGGIERMGLQQGDIMWGPLPMFHTAFIQPLTGILYVGGTYLSMTHFDAEVALEMIRREGATLMFPAFPTITMQLLNHAAYSERSFSAVRAVLNVGPPAELRAMQKRMPHTVQITVFGMTETGGSAAMCELKDTLKLRSDCSGRALPGNQIEIRDPDTGMAIQPGSIGEIVVRGRGVFAGYFNAPQKTVESFYEGGWFRTGDLGSVDAQGRVTFRGRLKDMLKVGGENVAAAEVEGFLATHPAVNLAQVVAVPDKKYGEVVGAFVELVPGAVADEQEIMDYCKEEIASFKVPRYVRFIKTWPMGATKILKSELQARLCAEVVGG
ncbi:MAG: acyl--CoA ligase [Gammaproteobacteria bacterium]|nr:acyl--CoA ligase [Gammaproteobacteria bacterium]MBT5685105.1 acyl--CoA ligase [Gammaproteobacteria bacterium]MBT6582820.1 acyl--CoA ligase [Gammaproteobacteria bacterium]